jgi:hypothetical protein
MSAEIAADGWQGAAGKSPAFAGGNEADVRRNRCGRLAGRSRRKPRLLPAATKLMSAKIASCDFGQ